MVKDLGQGSAILYICEVCGFAYKEKELAEKCEQWCEEHRSCNLEITRYAVRLK